MSIMSIREFNASVSRTIARVQAGETIDITRNGQVVAELRPKYKNKNDDPAFQAARERLKALLAQPLPGLTGPATLDERTER